MDTIYQVYIDDGNGDLAQARWFPQRGTAINYAWQFHTEHPSLTVVVCAETFALPTHTKPSAINEIWRRDAEF